MSDIGLMVPRMDEPPSWLVESVAFGPFQEDVEPVGGVVYAMVQVAELGEEGGYGSDGELAWIDLVDLVPGDGDGYGRCLLPRSGLDQGVGRPLRTSRPHRRPIHDPHL
jgi:hypothetical protein